MQRTSLALANFLTLSHKRHDLRKTATEHKMCFDFLYSFYLKHLSFLEELSEILSHMQKYLHVKHPLFLSDFNET